MTFGLNINMSDSLILVKILLLNHIIPKSMIFTLGEYNSQSQEAQPILT